MHDLDRNRRDTGEIGELEHATGEQEEVLGLLGSLFGELEDTGEVVAVLPAGELGVPLTELQETELASELLELSSEQELEFFLRDLIGSAARAAGTFVRSDTGRALGRVLKTATRSALPIVGRAVGQWVSPGRGGAAGARIGRAVGTAFGLELEGLSGEDRELEVARALVRFADGAARNAAVLAQRGLPGPVAARRGVIVAARAHAPGLLPSGSPDPVGGNESGRWVRRGRKIVIFDV